MQGAAEPTHAGGKGRPRSRSGGGLQLAGRVPLGALHERIKWRLREVVGVVRDQLGRGEDEYVEHGTIVVARRLEGRHVAFANDAAAAPHLRCELAKGFALAIGAWAPF